MDVKLQEAFFVTLAKATAATEKISDFAISETHEVVEQMLTYNYYFSLMWFLVGVGMLISVAVMVRIGIKDKWENEVIVISTIIISVFFGAVGPVIIAENLDWIKIWLAPKVYLLEYAAELAK